MSAPATISNRIDSPTGLPLGGMLVGDPNPAPVNRRLPAEQLGGENESTASTSPGSPRALAGNVLDPLNCADWDERVNRWPTASVFHSSAWLAVLADSYGFKPFAVVAPAEAGGRAALLPMMECASPLFGRRGVSLPFTDAVPALADTAGAVPALFERALELARARRWRSLELRGGAGFDNAPPSVTFLGHWLDLNRGADGLWSCLDDSVRRALRKAVRAGVEVCCETSWESVEHFYGLHCQTRRMHGLPPQPLSFFRNIHRHLIARGAGCVFSARHQGQLLAAAVFLHRGRHAVYKFGASDKSRQDLRANNAVMWEAIKRYAAEGFESLDFGRTSCQQAGLRRFKLGWGTRETAIAYWKFDLRRRAFAAGKDRSTGWHTALFRRLPLPVLRWLGARLYPHLI